MQKTVYCTNPCKDLSKEATGFLPGVQPEEQSTALIKEEGI